jgi:hypothetical protein
MTTLEDLYNGNINPCELQHLTKREDYNIAMSRAGDAREELEKKYEVVRLDPKNIIANDSINKLKTSVMDYIDKIDTTLSIINAKTEVTIEY